ARFSSLQALLADRALDAETEKKALDDAEVADVRRVAVAVLGGTGGGLSDDERMPRIRTALADSDLQVRYEAVRAWIRHGVPVEGCAPLVAALKDDDASVALEA